VTPPTAANSVTRDGCRFCDAGPCDDLFTPGPCGNHKVARATCSRHLCGAGSQPTFTVRLVDSRSSFARARSPKAARRTRFEFALWQLCRLAAGRRAPQPLISSTTGHFELHAVPSIPAAGPGNLERATAVAAAATPAKPPMSGLPSVAPESAVATIEQIGGPRGIPVMINGMRFTGPPRADRIEPS